MIHQAAKHIQYTGAEKYRNAGRVDMTKQTGTLWYKPL